MVAVIEVLHNMVYSLGKGEVMNRAIYKEFLEDTGQDGDGFELSEYIEFLENEVESLRLQLEFANTVVNILGK